jgi:phytoene/squalene synthetase
MSLNLKHFEKISFKTSELITKTYSTSFSTAVGVLPKETRKAIYSIYGFVRFADEIVDTFHNHDKKYLIDTFENDLNYALKTGLSLNPVLHSFSRTITRYNIDLELIQAFLKSMKADIEKKEYKNQDELNEYIYGSADVVGLMCLKVFLNGDDDEYARLLHPAVKLGSAFQKVNFLRDLKADTLGLHRIYFPQLASGKLDENIKNEIISNIEADFTEARKGIVQLPGKSKLAVMITYNYYRSLLRRLKNTQAENIASKRIRIPDFVKLILMLKTMVWYKLGKTS